jgi:hypothetical protein
MHWPSTNDEPGAGDEGVAAMRRLETLLLAWDLVTFVVIVVPLRPRWRWVRQVALAALPLAIVQALVEGPRWQMVPAYALSATFFLVWLFTTAGSPRRPGERTWIRHAGFPLLVSLGVVVLAMAVFVPWALPVFGFRHPHGPYRIGTVTYHWWTPVATRFSASMRRRGGN